MDSQGGSCIFRVPNGIAASFREAACWTAGTSIEEVWVVALCGKYGSIDVLDVLSKDPDYLPPWILCSSRTLEGVRSATESGRPHLSPSRVSCSGVSKPSQGSCVNTLKEDDSCDTYTAVASTKSTPLDRIELAQAAAGWLSHEPPMLLRVLDFLSTTDMLAVFATCRTFRSARCLLAEREAIALRRLGFSPTDAFAQRQFRKLSLIYGSPEEAEARMSQLVKIGGIPPSVAMATPCPAMVASRIPQGTNICFRSPGHSRDGLYICFAFLAGDDLLDFAAQLEHLMEERPLHLQASLHQVKAIVESAVQSQDCVVVRHII
eukprot:jgi/Botrbrau1/3719/Bobra.0363s0006.1